ncbi:hypothetical protein [Pseudomonas sp. UBA1879]|uniref:hypothetical protein n=1 Tax=Pseudomonas sp. UBA1879 TaxID=1947305 RepID=UPI0025E693D1|nr:hypothetical protein [Pseudomonas sp. UBA1879]
MSKTNHGAVVVDAGGTTYNLIPNLRAVRAIQNQFGGLLPAYSAIGSGNLSGIAFIIAAASGIDTSKRKELEKVEEAVFEGGVSAVGNKVIPFVRALLNPGGKTDEELEEAAGEGNEKTVDTSTSSSD